MNTFHTIAEFSPDIITQIHYYEEDCYWPVTTRILLLVYCIYSL